jgi:hypothetical protein
VCHHTSRNDLFDLLRLTEVLDVEEGRPFKLEETIRSPSCLGERGALRLLRPLSAISDSVTTIVCSLTPAQLKEPATDPATLLADCASPLTLDDTEAAPLDLTESKAVLVSSLSSVGTTLSLEAASLACSMYFSLLASLKLKYLRL